MRKSTKNSTVVVSARTLAAYRAHRTRLAQQMKGCTKSVRVELAAKVAAFDAKLAEMTVRQAKIDSAYALADQAQAAIIRQRGKKVA